MSFEENIHYSVVIPVCNEQDSAEPLVREIRATLEPLGRGFEIIFVDDGSHDHTAGVLDRLHHEDARVCYLRLDDNYGQSTALWAGIKTARGPIIITMDGDLQNNPRDIPLLLEKLGRYHMAAGWRQERKDSLSKRLSTRVANGVRNVLTMEDIHDSACGFRAFYRECLAAVVSFDGMHRFLPTLFRMQGLRVCEVPIPHHKRRFGNSHYNIRNRLFRGLIDLWGIRWLKKRRISYGILEEHR